ncbi:MAG: hydrogenase iron-sulfur subunit, partial [Promethearchaeota archaeon]
MICFCTCGNTIDIDYDSIRENIGSNFPDTKIMVLNAMCNGDDLEKLTNELKLGDYKGFLFVGCSPQIIEMKLRLELKKNQLEDIVFEIVNIREQCYWVHDSDDATYKANILVKAHFIKLLNTFYKKIDKNFLDKSVIIIGGGIAGLEVAINLQKLGYDITLIEIDKDLGGYVKKLPIIHPYKVSGEDFINKRINRLDSDITIYKNWTIEWIDGKLGNYSLKLLENNNSDNEKIINGSIIVFTTGHDIFRPKINDFYRYNEEDRVISLFELGNVLRSLNSKNKTEKLNSKNILKLFENKKSTRNILIVQCVGSRDKNYYEHCSKYCCTTAINYSIELLKRFPNSSIFISYIDIRTPWTSEYEYKKARDMGVNFIRGKVGSIEKIDDKLIATIYDTIVQKLMKIDADLVVLSTALIPKSENMELFNQLKINTWNKGFIKSKYAKLRNVETSRNGIFACGTATGPKLIEETINEAKAISMEIIKLLEEPKLFSNYNVTIIDQEKCNGCELCARICPFNIPRMIPQETDSESKIEYLAEIDPFSCRGCGTCNAICPTAAAQLQQYSQNEIFSQIKSLLEDSNEFTQPIILGFVCDECAYASVDILGLLRKKYPENIRLIRIPCGGRLSLLDILKCYSDGASGVFLLACGDDKCHYIDGNVKGHSQIEAAEEILESIGWDRGRTAY